MKSPRTVIQGVRHNNGAESSPARLRRLATSRGHYIVNWEPSHLNYLIESEGLKPEELIAGDPEGLHGLVRELFLLGLQDEMAGDEFGDARVSSITRFARKLLRIAGSSNSTRDPAFAGV